MLKPQQWTEKQWAAHAALCEQGTLWHLMHKGQKKFWKEMVYGTDCNYALWYCARQLGKSHSAAIYGVMHCLQTPMRIVRWIFPTLKTAKEVATAKIAEIIATLPQHLKPQHRRADSEWIFPNGSIIKLGGADPAGADNNRGNYSTLIILDEAGFFDEKSFDYLVFSVLMPQTTHYPEAKIVALTTPPETVTHPSITSFAPLAKRQNSFMTSTIFDNPLLSKEQINRLIDALGGPTSNASRRELFAELIQDDSARVIPEYTAKNFKDYTIPQTDFTFTPAEFLGVVCLDYGVSSRDLTAITASVFDWVNQKMVIVKEQVLHAPGLRQTAEIVKQFETDLRVNYRCEHVDIIADMFASTGLEFRTEHGINFRNPSKVKLIDMVASFRSAVEHEEIVVTTDCKKTNDTLLNGLWKKTATTTPTFDRTQELGHLDLLACLIYTFRYIPWGAKGLNTSSRKDILAPLNTLPTKKETVKNADGSILKFNPNFSRTVGRKRLF